MGNGVSKEKNKLKPIDTPVYRYWQALYMSFYSRRLYVDVAKRWRGFGFIYLLLVIVVFSIPFFLRISNNFNHSFKEQLTDPLLKLPVFYIQDGEVSFDKPMPYLIKNDRGQVVAIIDTTGKINGFSSLYPNLDILVNRNKISFKTPRVHLFNTNQPKLDNNEPFVQNFDQGTNMVFNGKKLVAENSIKGLKYSSQAVLYLMTVAVFFSIFFVFFMVLALLGQAFSNIFFSFKLTFMKSNRLLIVAGTPMLLVLLIVLAFNILFQGLGVVLLSLLIGYYNFALYCYRAESKQAVIS